MEDHTWAIILERCSQQWHPQEKKFVPKLIESTLEKVVLLTLRYEDEINKKLVIKQIAIFHIPLTVWYNIGGNKESSGKNYNSISGHRIVVGGYSKKILQHKTMSKVCSFCDRV